MKEDCRGTSGGGLIGFAHTAFDEDPTWGALLDNLHVAHGRAEASARSCWL